MYKKIIKYWLVVFAIVALYFITSCGKKYAVSFYVDDISIHTIDVKKNKTVTKITDPSKENYIFVGWYLGDSEYDFSSKVTSDITLHAKFNFVCDVSGHTWENATIDAPKTCSVCKITEGDKIPKVESIQITSPTYLFVGETIEITAVCMPSESNQNVTFSVTSKDNNASINDSGILTGLVDGTVYVTATSTENPNIKETITVSILHNVMDSNTYDAFNIMTGFGSNASTDVEINYHTHNNHTFVEYTLATDPEFNNLTTMTGFTYFFEDLNPELESVFNARNIVRVSLTNLTPNTEYIYRINKGNDTYSDVYSFKTSPNDGSDSSFLVLADIHYHVKYDEANNPLSTGAESSEALVQKALEMSPNIGFIATAGDSIDRGGSSNTWDIFFENSASLKTLPRIGVVGNHEFYISNNSTAQLDNRYHIINHSTPFNGPAGQIGSSGYFLYNDILFLAVDNESGTSKSNLLNWLDYVLTTVEARYTIAIMHRPIFYEDGSIDRDEKMMKIFEKHCVDLVLSGHYHSDDLNQNYFQGETSEDSLLGVNYLSLHSAGNKGASATNPASGYLIETSDGVITVKRFYDDGTIKSTRVFNTKKEENSSSETLENLANEISGTYNEETNSYSINFSSKFYGNIISAEIKEVYRNEFSEIYLFKTPSYDTYTINNIKKYYDYQFEITLNTIAGESKTITVTFSQTDNSTFEVYKVQDGKATLKFVPNDKIKYNIYNYAIVVNQDEPINFDSIDKYSNPVNYYTINNISATTKYIVTLLALDNNGGIIYSKTLTLNE